MSNLDRLPEITESVLSGLRADEALKYRICRKAASDPVASESRSSRRPVIALLSLSAAMVFVFIMLGSLRPVSDDPETVSSQITTISAGERRTDSPIGLGAIIDEALQDESVSTETLEDDCPGDEAEKGHAE